MLGSNNKMNNVYLYLSILFNIPLYYILGVFIGKVFSKFKKHIFPFLMILFLLSEINYVGAAINVEVNFLENKPEGETLPFLSNQKIKNNLENNLFTPFSIALNEYLKSLGLLNKT